MQKTITLIFFSTIYLFAAAQKKWNLQDCIEYGFLNNISKKQNDIQTELATIQIKRGKNEFLPSLNTSLGPSLSFGRSPIGIDFSYTTQSITNSNISGNLNYVIFNGNQRLYNKNLNEVNWKIALAQNEKLKYDMALSLAANYLQTLLSKEQIKIAELQIQNTKAQLHNTTILFKASLKPEIDVSEIETQITKDSLNIVIAEEAFQQNLLSLKNYLSLDPLTPFDIEIPLVENISITELSNFNPESIFEYAAKEFPIFKINNYKLEVEKVNLKIAKASKSPTVSLDLGISSGYSQVLSQTAYSKVPFFTQSKNNFRQFINLSLTYPVFDGFKTKNNISRSKINIRGQEQFMETDKLKLKQDIYKAYQDAKNGFQKLKVSELGVIASRKTLDISEKKYKAGILNTIELINNQNNFFRAKQENIINRYDYIFKIKILDFYSGKKISL